MDIDDLNEFVPWLDKPRVTLEQFMKGAKKTGRLFYGDVVHVTPSGHRIVEIESGEWDGYILIISFALWQTVKDRGGIQEE